MLILVLTGLLRGVRTHRALVLENLALRHQLGVLQRTAPRPRLRASDRVFWVLLARLWHGWAEVFPSQEQPGWINRRDTWWPRLVGPRFGAG